MYLLSMGIYIGVLSIGIYIGALYTVVSTNVSIGVSMDVMCYGCI